MKTLAIQAPAYHIADVQIHIALTDTADLGFAINADENPPESLVKTLDKKCQILQHAHTWYTEAKLGELILECSEITTDNSFISDTFESQKVDINPVLVMALIAEIIEYRIQEILEETDLTPDQISLFRRAAKDFFHTSKSLEIRLREKFEK